MIRAELIAERLASALPAAFTLGLSAAVSMGHVTELSVDGGPGPCVAAWMGGGKPLYGTSEAAESPAATASFNPFASSQRFLACSSIPQPSKFKTKKPRTRAGQEKK